MKYANSTNCDSNRSGTRTARIDAIAEWRGGLTGVVAAILVFEALSGLFIYVLPFSLFNQFGVIVHTLAGLVMVVPATWFLIRHWRVRHKGAFNHFQLLGYITLALLLVATVSGLVLTWQGVAETRIDRLWDLLHLIPGLGMGLFLLIHLVMIATRNVGATQTAESLKQARRSFYSYILLGNLVLIAACGIWSVSYQEPPLFRGFASDYNWRFGEQLPFAPSMARLDYSNRSDGLTKAGFSIAENLEAAGAIQPYALSGSKNCGSAGCHREIYQEWLPSAHRYSSMDDMFQEVQTIMVAETAPEYTRYCAGCHDPISLFSGAKNKGNVTLSAEGSDEGSSCLVCHSIVQADVQGNGDYTIRPARRYAYELAPGVTAKFISDFLIRTYPQQHIQAYSRPLYKTAEFCAACHKQYIDKEVNIDIGKVQGQNQYDSWKNSRWYHEGEPEKTITCRECHMPLVAGDDPARGDSSDYNRSANDAKHRGHRTLAGNQYIPVLQSLTGGEEHARLTEKWLRGEIDIPEISDKWTTGPVIRMDILAPNTVSPGQEVRIQTVLANNKTGHDFPTGPLDMLESWVELKVTDAAGKVVYHVGGVDTNGVIQDTPLSYRADGFDRKGELIDRHNLWDLVGVGYKRTLYPGMTDSFEARFNCPSMARGRVITEKNDTDPGKRTEGFSFAAPAAEVADQLQITATLWYRKANPDFLDRVYGADSSMRSPLTRISRATASINVSAHTDRN